MTERTAFWRKKPALLPPVPASGGVSAEIGFRVFEEVFDYLDGPIRRVTTPDIPVPASPSLEDAALPNRDDIVNAALDMMQAT